MDTPPFVADPNSYVDPAAVNPGSEGVRVSWDAMRWFYGRVINQAWTDLDNIERIGVIIV